jgi:phage recombination protein Bet
MVPTFTAEQIELIKRTIAKGATNDELQMFLALCQRTGLDPFARQIYAILRWDSRAKREVMQTQTSIDGFRLIADRSGKYEGQVGPFWCGRDGVWKDVWVPNEPPVAAKVGVLKTGCREPFWGISRFSEYCQVDRDGNLTAMWRKMPANQLAKTAEALALRKAFPHELSGMYASEEMDHVGDPEPPAPAAQEKPEKPEELERPWKTFKGMVEAFGALKPRLGPDADDIYTTVLEQFGVQHCNQFKNHRDAAAAYHQLAGIVEEREAKDTTDPEYDVVADGAEA